MLKGVAIILVLALTLYILLLGAPATMASVTFKVNSTPLSTPVDEPSYLTVDPSFMETYCLIGRDAAVITEILAIMTSMPTDPEGAVTVNTGAARVTVGVDENA